MADDSDSKPTHAPQGAQSRTIKNPATDTPAPTQNTPDAAVPFGTMPSVITQGDDDGSMAPEPGATDDNPAQPEPPQPVDDDHRQGTTPPPHVDEDD